MKKLIVYRLMNGDRGNKATLEAYLRKDGTLQYSHFGGWGTGGMPYSIKNLQMSQSLPMGTNDLKNVEALDKKIRQALATGYGSNQVSAHEILNKL